jgi:hypothetical protein
MNISELVISVWNIFEKFYFSRPHVLHILRNLIESTYFALPVISDILPLHSLRPKYVYKLYCEKFVMKS